MTLPNVITLARLACVPLCVWLLLIGAFATGFWVILAAGLSDAIDGFLARRLNLVSRLGALLDTIADKALLAGVFLTLGYQDYVETWLVILIVFRDLLIIVGALVLQLVTGILQVKPSRISKLNTAAQIMLAVLVVAQLAFGWQVDLSLTYFSWFVAVTTVLSGTVYMMLWGRQLNGAERAGTGSL